MAIKIGGSTVVDNNRNIVDVLNISSSGISTFGSIVLKSGIVTSTSGGIVTYFGDGSALTGIVVSGGGIVVKDSGTIVGTAGTIDFGDNLTVSAISAGIVTVTGSASGGGGSIGVSSNSISSGNFSTLNFVGAGVTASGSVANVTVNKTFTIGLRSGATSLNVSSGISTIQLRNGIGSIYF